MKYDVAVLGATGMVGQRYVKILSKHPWFNLVALSASPQKAGARYGDVVSWVIGGTVPEEVAEIRLSKPEPSEFKDIDIVFSALPTDISREIEPKFVSAGLTVFSDSSPMRLDPRVPLVIPEINADHLSITAFQRSVLGGVLVKTPNCTSNVLSLAIKPLIDLLGIPEHIDAVSLQAISGAGYSGLPSMAIQDNVIPYIKNEEEKMLEEPRKIYGRVSNMTIEPNESLYIDATTTRVPVLDGHTVVIHAHYSWSVDINEVLKAYENFRSYPQELRLPTAPEKPLILHRAVDRPQPRLDRDLGNGMSVSIGRIRIAAKRGGSVVKLVALGHNTIRGAAGNTVLNAETYISLGLSKR
ncbi:aspartate-semialdehyde dehydrogenase [Desulfurococcaceae archaeon AG1]|jgi:aspartate-semialdehyde dehydrogenase|nr:MAG: aspartate-semialdehyde dehydrogenase [Desulfurococcaceae archaeon]GAY25335.1 aspartate-semialdehyde dehydrogenase [Desulfurococcaceae archaeon AG1]